MSTSEYLEALNEVKKKGLAALEDSNGWKVSSNSNDTLRIESRPSDTFNCSVYRAVQQIKAPIDVVRDTVNFLPGGRRQEWDQDIREVAEIEKLKDNTYIYAFRTNSVAKGVISPREFINIGTIEDTDQGTVIVACSIDHPACKEDGNYVRALNVCTVVKIEKDPDDSDLVRTTTISELDLKGRLPRYLVDSAIPKAMSNSFSSWRKFLEKEGHLQQP